MQITRDTITLHGREGLALDLFFFDEAGAVLPVAGRSYFFEIESIFRVAMTVGPAANQVTLAENRAACAGVGPAATLFALIDETEPVQSVIWSGTIRRTGYAEAPPAI